MARDRKAAVFVGRERPQYLLAEHSSGSATDMHEETTALLSQYCGEVDIQTGSTFLPQFTPKYRGMTHPYTLPFAVGGYDVSGEPRWRRPEIDEHIFQNFTGATFEEGEACLAKLFDVARGLPQRIEGQYRRIWSFAPACWN